MINERVKQRQRYISMKKVEAIKELIAKGELTEDALRWKMRKPRTASEEAKVKSEVKDEDGKKSLSSTRKYYQARDPTGTHMINKNGQPRAMPCRWSHSEHKTFVDMLKNDGKQWTRIAEAIGTKNEQQCRTRGLILFNKLKKHCWDKELFDVLAPHGKYSYRDTPRLPRQPKKTLRLGGTLRNRENDTTVKKEVKSECSEEATTDEKEKQSEKGTCTTKSLLENLKRSRICSLQSAALHREKVRKIKEEYMQKKRERKLAAKIAREERKALIKDTKLKIRAERHERMAQAKLERQNKPVVAIQRPKVRNLSSSIVKTEKPRKRLFRQRGQTEKMKDAEAQRQVLLQQRRKITKGKCLVIGNSLRREDIEKVKARAVKRDSEYDPDSRTPVKVKKEPRNPKAAKVNQSASDEDTKDNQSTTEDELIKVKNETAAPEKKKKQEDGAVAKMSKETALQQQKDRDRQREREREARLKKLGEV